MYVELVVDIHLPGKLTRAEERRGEEEENRSDDNSMFRDKKY